MLVKFKRKENERNEAYHKVTHAYMKQIQDQEAFINLEMHGASVCLIIPITLIILITLTRINLIT
jgi:hypothetical protein